MFLPQNTKVTFFSYYIIWRTASLYVTLSSFTKEQPMYQHSMCDYIYCRHYALCCCIMSIPCRYHAVCFVLHLPLFTNCCFLHVPLSLYISFLSPPGAMVRIPSHLGNQGKLLLIFAVREFGKKCRSQTNIMWKSDSVICLMAYWCQGASDLLTVISCGIFEKAMAAFYHYVNFSDTSFSSLYVCMYVCVCVCVCVHTHIYVYVLYPHEIKIWLTYTCMDHTARHLHYHQRRLKNTYQPNELQGTPTVFLCGTCKKDIEGMAVECINCTHQSHIQCVGEMIRCVNNYTEKYPFHVWDSGKVMSCVWTLFTSKR